MTRVGSVQVGSRKSFLTLAHVFYVLFAKASSVGLFYFV